METAEIVMLGTFAGFVAVLWGTGMRMLYSEIEHQVAKINVERQDLQFSAEIKQEIYDLLQMALEDTVGNIQMPTALDHFAGFASMWAQKKFLGNAPNIIEGVTELAGYGATQQQEEEVQG